VHAASEWSDETRAVQAKEGTSRELRVRCYPAVVGFDWEDGVFLVRDRKDGTDERTGEVGACDFGEPLHRYDAMNKELYYLE
jgi:hypothetical protein